MSRIDLLDRPIAFHRCFVTLTGSITGGLFLSQCLYWSKRTKSDDGWFYKTTEEWKEETGMSRHELDGAREKLRALGLISEERRGVPAKLFYKLDCQKLEILLAEMSQSSLPESGKLKGRKAANKTAEKQETYKEAETTTENTTESALSPAFSVSAIWQEVFGEPITIYAQETLTSAVSDFDAFRRTLEIWKMNGYSRRGLDKILDRYSQEAKNNQTKQSVTANHLRLIDQMPAGLDDFGKTRWLKEQLAKGVAA